ncbi:MAG: GTPase [Candidatus Eisenbacteria bacterium]
MPANLTPQYFHAEEKYKEAKNVRDKLKALRGMLSAIPKHKGTEKLQGDIKRRIALLTEEEERAKKSGGRGPGLDHVPREGSGQVVIVGVSNAGKSALFDALTHAEPVVAPYPFSTQKPQPGMVEFGGVQIQLVDSPAWSDEYMEAWVPNVARSGHAVILAIDLSGETDPEDQLLTILGHMEEAGMSLVPEPEWGTAVIGDPVFRKRALALGTRADLAKSVPAEVGGFPIHPVSAETGAGMSEVPGMLFDLLRIIRVYSKMPHRPPDYERPFTLDAGSNVGDLCRIVHKDFADKLRFARLWREDSFQGIQVHRDHDLVDKDVVELHM